MNAFYEATVGKGGLMSIARVPDACKWHYFAPFFSEFATNHNPAPLVTNPYGKLDRAGLVERGLLMDAASAQPRAVFAAICDALDVTPYTNVVRHLASRPNDQLGAYMELVKHLAEDVFRAQEHVPAEQVEDFVEVALALLEHRSWPGVARAFLTHVLGCCIVEPGAYLQDLQAVCSMDQHAFAQAFGTRRPGDFVADAPASPTPAAPAWDVALEVGHFEEISGMGTLFVPDGKGAWQAWRVPDDGSVLVVEVGRAPRRGGASITLDDRCVSMAHLTVHARREGAEGGLAVELTDHSTCGTVVFQQEEGGGYTERRLGEFVSGLRFAGCKVRPQAPASARLSDGDLVIPAPRFSRGEGGAPVLDSLACPAVIRVALAR